ncbi:hypothetical protein [Paraburkholderia sp. BCC1885]|uniref:hypothetical protein n=1 Tax=Paraburkholderia sp. BCC1885 TaxID=2562669 RepID=UPI0011826CCB|nr:hypothetical protein [Paraburkholderia sp. BCC1885]
MLPDFCRKALLYACVLFAGCASPLSAVHAQSATQFHNEQEARQHCPKDTVVWVNTKTGVYHFKGQRWYANTNEGAYECRKEADGEGDRATRNGQ